MCDSSVSSAAERILRALGTSSTAVPGSELLRAIRVADPLCPSHFAFGISELLKRKRLQVAGQPLFAGRIGMKECQELSYELASEGAWVLNERWEVLDRLGSGGMAEVYRGRQRKLGGRLVAIKIPAVEHLAPEARVEAIERAKREATILANLNHPAIVTIHEAEEDADGTFYLVMELLDGGSLAERVRKRGALPWEEVIDFAVPMAEGFALASSRGVLHRDIKPQNILFDTSGRVRITDFGLGKILAGSAPVPVVEDPATRIQAIRGTFEYMAPERLRQASGADESERADVFSCGVTLYEALAGKHPFPGLERGAAPMEVQYRLLMTKPVPLHEALPDCPRELADAVDRMMQSDPELRYPSFERLANDLKRIGARAARRTTRIAARPSARKVESRDPAAGAVRGLASATDTAFAAHLEACDRSISEMSEAIETEFGPLAGNPKLLRAIWALAAERDAREACEALWKGVRGDQSVSFAEAYEAVLRAIETGGSLPPSAWLVPLDLRELLRVSRRKLETARRKSQPVDAAPLERLLAFLWTLPARPELAAFGPGSPEAPPPPLPAPPTTSEAPSTRRVAIRARREAIDGLHRKVGEEVGAWFKLYGESCFGWNSVNPRANELLERLFELAKERKLVDVLELVRRRQTNKPTPDFVELYERLLDFHARRQNAPSDPAATIQLEIPNYATQDLNQASTALANDEEHDPAAAREILAFLKSARDHAALAPFRLPQAPTRPPIAPTTHLSPNPSVSPEDLAGHALGDYELLEVIGKGGMGVVYRAKDKTLDRDVAVKVMSADVAREADFAERFQNEARVAARLQHANLVHVYLAGKDGGLLWYAMELVASRQTLAAYLSAEGKPLPAPLALGIARRIAEGLQAIHEAKLVHRDVKPENVMIVPGAPGEPPKVKILDAGLVKPVSAPDGTRTTRFFIGTPEYCSPEQAREESVDARSDLYSLGVVLYGLLAGPGADRPYQATSATTYLLKTADPKTMPVPLRDRNSAVPAPVAALVHRLLEKDPAKRYPSAPALIQAIDDLLEGIEQRESGAERRLLQRRRFALAALAALLLVALLAAFLLRPGGRPGPPVAFDVKSGADLSKKPPEPESAPNEKVEIQTPAPPTPEEPAPQLVAAPPTRTFPADAVYGPPREDSAEALLARHVPGEEELRTLERLLEIGRRSLPARQAYDVDAGLALLLAFEAKERLTPWLALLVDAERTRLEAGRSAFSKRPLFPSKNEERTILLRDSRTLRARVLEETPDLLTVEPVATGLREEHPLALIGPATFPAAAGTGTAALLARSAAGDATGTLPHLQVFDPSDRRRYIPFLVDQAIEEALLEAASRRDMKALIALELPEEFRRTGEALFPARLRLLDAEREAARLYERRERDPEALRTLLVQMSTTHAARAAGASILERWEKTLGGTEDDDLAKSGLGDYKLGGNRYAWKVDTNEGRHGSISWDPKKNRFLLRSAGPEKWVWMSRLVDRAEKGYRIHFALSDPGAAIIVSTRPGRQCEISARNLSLLRRVDQTGVETAKRVNFARPLAGGRFDVVPRKDLVLLHLDGALLAAIPRDDWGIVPEFDLGAHGGEVVISKLIVVDSK